MPAYSVEYRPKVLEEDFPVIPRNMLARIFRAVESRLTNEPAHYGVRLRRSLAGLWKVRVGDYRVVYAIQGTRVTIHAVQHRKNVYDAVEARLLE